MTEAIETLTPKSKLKGANSLATDRAIELPNFGMPKMEFPAAFRELAEKSIIQTKETYEKFKTAAEQATDALEDSYATAAKGASDFGLKLIEAARENSNATFDFASRLLTVRSLAEVVELSTSHTRQQYEAVATQSKELAAIAQRVAKDTTEPIKETMGKAFKLA